MKQRLTKLKGFFPRVWGIFKSLALWKKIAVVLGLVVILFLLKGCFFKSRPAPLFKMATVEKGNIVDMVEASGPINPVNTTEVGALVSGEILKI